MPSYKSEIGFPVTRKQRELIEWAEAHYFKRKLWPHERKIILDAFTEVGPSAGSRELKIDKK